LIANDMMRVVSERMVEATTGVGVQCGRENASVLFGVVMLALEKERKSERRFGASERVLIKECMLVAQFPPHFVGVRVVAVGWGS
jgi:hypothetical protein